VPTIPTCRATPRISRHKIKQMALWTITTATRHKSAIASYALPTNSFLITRTRIIRAHVTCAAIRALRWSHTPRTTPSLTFGSDQPNTLCARPAMAVCTSDPSRRSLGRHTNSTCAAAATALISRCHPSVARYPGSPNHWRSVLPSLSHHFRFLGSYLRQTRGGSHSQSTRHLLQKHGHGLARTDSVLKRNCTE
jgi:hypothetical protein